MVLAELGVNRLIDKVNRLIDKYATRWSGACYPQHRELEHQPATNRLVPQRNKRFVQMHNSPNRGC
jgi:hypothetical protein